MGISYDFSGLDFEAMSAAVLARAPKALAAGGEVIRADSDSRVPVGNTQHLIGSSEVVVEDLVAAISYNTPYARYQEFGIYFRRPAHYGALLTHEGGKTSFFLTIAMILSEQAALAEVQRVMFP